MQTSHRSYLVVPCGCTLAWGPALCHPKAVSRQPRAPPRTACVCAAIRHPTCMSQYFSNGIPAGWPPPDARQRPCVDRRPASADALAGAAAAHDIRPATAWAPAAGACTLLLCRTSMLYLDQYGGQLHCSRTADLPAALNFRFPAWFNSMNRHVTKET